MTETWKDPETPRWGHEPVEMRRIPEGQGMKTLGEFVWSIVGDIRYIGFAVPRRRHDGELTLGALNYLPVVTGAPPISAGVWGWDGNEDAPTLTPSVHCIGHWHGYVRAGELVEA